MSPLSTLERATRHCPWSGSLWAQYLLTSEREGQTFPETEEIKHKATNTGLLDVGGTEEVLKVHTAWCCYLKRRAFRLESSDEDLDIAEMGIRSSIENLQELSKKKHGGTNPDPMFRLQRIYINYLTESGSRDSARDAYRGLIPKQGDSWEFWCRFYVWEMMCWTSFIQGGKVSANESTGKTRSPRDATAVLKEALKRPHLDWPEKIVQTLIMHCEDYEDAEELQLAIVEVDKVEKRVAKRRAQEVSDAGQAAVQAQDINGDPRLGVGFLSNGVHTGKRKRDEDMEVEASSKRNRFGTVDTHSSQPDTQAQPDVKRDRENATILVQNLPDPVTETRVRQFFRDCGIVKSIKVLRQNGTSAIVEFEEKEAALFAQTRDHKDLDGSIVRIQAGSGSTIFVANFPPTADEAYIKNSFNKYGEIMEVRFPSLKYNTHRRFCYVQFQSNAQAQAATALDGHDVGNGLKLVARLSNPAIKQGRSGALEEGRELYVRNIHWSASEEDVEQLFSKYGSIEAVRIPRNAEGKSKGFGFVVFSSQVSESSTLSLNILLTRVGRGSCRTGHVWGGLQVT